MYTKADLLMSSTGFYILGLARVACLLGRRCCLAFGDLAEDVQRGDAVGFGVRGEVEDLADKGFNHPPCCRAICPKWISSVAESPTT